MARVIGIQSQTPLLGLAFHHVLYRDAFVAAKTSDGQPTPFPTVEPFTAAVYAVAVKTEGVEDVVAEEMGTFAKPGAVDQIADALDKASQRPTSVPDSVRDAVTVWYSRQRFFKDITELYGERRQGIGMKAKVGKEIAA